MDINISARKLNGACSHFVVLRPMVRAGNLHSIIVFPLNQGEYLGMGMVLGPVRAWDSAWTKARPGTV